MTGDFEAVAQGIGQTLAITSGAFVVGAGLAVPVALMRRSPNPGLRLPATVLVEVLRAVPPIVWLFLIYHGLAQDGLRTGTAQAAILGLGLIATAYLSEIYRAGLFAVAKGQWEAADALGLPALARYRRVVLPQALVVVIPPAATYAIGLLKDSAIASVIGAQDITFHAFQRTQETLEGLSIFAVTGALYIVLSLPVAAVARFTDRRLTSRLTR